MVPVGCGLVTMAGEGLLTGVVGISGVSGMVAGAVVCGNMGSVEISFWKSAADSFTSEDWTAGTGASYGRGCLSLTGSILDSTTASTAAGDATSSALLEILLDASASIAEPVPDSVIARTSAVSGIC